MHRCIAPADSPTLLTCKIGRLTSQYKCRLPRGEAARQFLLSGDQFRSVFRRVQMAPTAQTIAEPRGGASGVDGASAHAVNVGVPLRAERQFLPSGCGYCACCVYFD